MPNWCSTMIVFYSENKDRLAAFYERVNEIYEGKATQENDFGQGWLGDFANTYYPALGAECIECRGKAIDISQIEFNGERSSFKMWTWTAWTAKIGLFYRIIKDFYPEIKIAYVAEESGCEYYCVWDEEDLFCFGNYYVDACYPHSNGEEGYIDEHEFNTMKEIWDWLDNNLPFKVRHFKDEQKQERAVIKAIEKYLGEKNSEDYYCVIAKYDEIHPSDFPFQNNKIRS